MNYKKILLALAVAMLAVTSGCVASQEETGEDPKEVEEPAPPADKVEVNEKVERFTDDEAGVVCYVIDEEGAMGSGAGWQSGVSCIPIEETSLSE
mgnify:CR=1 FL=1